MRRSLLVLCVALAGCAAHERGQPPPQSVAEAPKSPMAQAATAPLGDLGLVHAPIPPVLLEALKDPYANAARFNCAQIAEHVRELDSVLGTDLDRPADANDPGLVERGTEQAKEAAVGAVRRTAEGVLPYRSWVRKLSGAERYSRDVTAAITAGTVRRGYLKGLGEARGCKSPAAPQRAR